MKTKNKKSFDAITVPTTINYREKEELNEFQQYISVVILINKLIIVGDFNKSYKIKTLKKYENFRNNRHAFEHNIA